MNWKQLLVGHEQEGFKMDDPGASKGRVRVPMRMVGYFREVRTLGWGLDSAGDEEVDGTGLGLD